MQQTTDPHIAPEAIQQATAYLITRSRPSELSIVINTVHTYARFIELTQTLKPAINFLNEILEKDEIEEFLGLLENGMN